MARIATFSLALILLLASAVASADEHRSDRAGHPLEIIGTLLHPVGVILDYVIFRPAHWLSHREPVRTLTEHEVGATGDEEEMPGHEEGNGGRDEED